jgi:uncharacterized protein with HEPN domain
MLTSDRVRLQHILDAAKRIVVISRGRSRHDVEDDLVLPFALLALLQIIGEAARHVSDEYQEEHSEIDWKGMTGLRNRLAHAYFDVDYDVLYKVIQEDIPPLISTIENLLDQLRLDL